MTMYASGLNKTEKSDLFVYSANASEILSFSSGEVSLQLSLPQNIENGKYSLCSSRKYFSDYLLFAVNLEDTYINYPGMYASLSPEGIVFTIWTSYGRFSVVDKTTSVSSGESFVVAFCWDSTGLKMGSGATMAVFVNDECTASSNHMIAAPSMSNLNFYSLDSEKIRFNLECCVYSVACFSSLPESRYDAVKSLFNLRQSSDEIIICGANGSLVFSDTDSIYKMNLIKSSYFSNYGVDVCDITGNVYFSTCFNDGFYSSFVSKFVFETSKITKIVKNFKAPVSVSVIQKDSIDYPRNKYYDNSECDGVWVSSADKLIRTNSDLVSQIQIDGFTNNVCVKSTYDKSCWVADSGVGYVYKYSFLGSLLESIAIPSPTYMGTTIKDDLYVYSSSEKKIYWINNDRIVDSIELGNNVSSIDVNVRNGVIVVGYSNGVIKRFTRKLVFEERISDLSRIDKVLVRRGYGQNVVLAFDCVTGRIKTYNLYDFSRNYGSVFFDKNILFNGNVAATAKNVGIETTTEVYFNMSFGVSRNVISSIDVDSYKVLRVGVDASGGRDGEAYFKSTETSSNRVPTDYHGKVLEIAELNDD